mmetsp:Transcript_99987/g.158262  ORF Transcript_99987/g.158262 Transcript_99987/m.158262 type:complete len:162 (-) Transcript_99987:167-652(-)
MSRSEASSSLRKAASKESVVAPPPPPVAVMKVMKTVTKPKALPTRGAVKASGAAGKAKAIASAAAAKVASTLKKSRSQGTLAGAGTWYFMSDLRKMKAGADDSKAWTKYNAKQNKALEDAYTKKFKQMTFKNGDTTYIVKFSSMMQFRADDKSLQRPVKRE